MTRYKIILWSTPKGARDITREAIRTTCYAWHSGSGWRWWSCSGFHAKHGIAGEPIDGKTIEANGLRHEIELVEMCTQLPNGDFVEESHPPWWQLVP